MHVCATNSLLISRASLTIGDLYCRLRHDPLIAANIHYEYVYTHIHISLLWIERQSILRFVRCKGWGRMHDIDAIACHIR